MQQRQQTLRYVYNDGYSSGRRPGRLYFPLLDSKPSSLSKCLAVIGFLGYSMVYNIGLRLTIGSSSQRSCVV